eukprot:8441795-Alexandrium_andersonii.AAC.1
MANDASSAFACVAPRRGGRAPRAGERVREAGGDRLGDNDRLGEDGGPLRYLLLVCMITWCQQ